jgi:G:T-mismatch repair DNA endonuclease (very short patch repair protein)
LEELGWRVFVVWECELRDFEKRLDLLYRKISLK